MKSTKKIFIGLFILFMINEFIGNSGNIFILTVFIQNILIYIGCAFIICIPIYFIEKAIRRWIANDPAKNRDDNFGVQL